MVISRFQFTSSIYKVNAIKEQMILSTSIVFETEATLHSFAVSIILDLSIAEGATC